jgi:hypothetical protein
MFDGPPLVFWFFFAFWLIFVLGGMVLWIWMLVDAVRVPDERFFRSGNKVLWIVLIAVLQVFGAIAYLVAGRPSKQARARWRQGGDLYEGRWAQDGTPSGPYPPHPDGTALPVPPPPPPTRPTSP